MTADPIKTAEIEKAVERETVIRARRYLLKPTPAQAEAFLQYAGVARLVYNLALEQRSTFWRQYLRAEGRHIGFPQSPYCAGQAGCLSCGAISSKSLPLCLADEVPPHIADDRGMPKLFRPRSPDQ